MIYDKPTQDINWQDVEEFCRQGIAENTYLDYKEDFPNNLAKTIAAMANTLGGIIFIGIKEDAESKPITPLKGIQFQRGLSERVTNIILSNITPPVFPEVGVCTNDDSTLALILINIPQSHQAHMQYLKIQGCISEPEIVISLRGLLILVRLNGFRKIVKNQFN